MAVAECYGLSQPGVPTTHLALRQRLKRRSAELSIRGLFPPAFPSLQGERSGAVLLADAVRRAHASASTVGSSMLVVDAIGERAAAFYEANGFVRLPDSMRLILPMYAIGKLLES